MAHVYQRGKQYWVQFRHKGKLYRASAGPYRRDADRLLEKCKREIRDGRFQGIKTRSGITFSEFAPRFLEWSRQHKRSWKRDELSVRNLSASFGDVALAGITPDLIERYKTARLGGALRFGRKDPGRSTVNRELRCLTKMISMAVDLDLLEENHLAGRVKMLKEPGGRVRYLSPEEAERLLVECAEHLRPIVHLALLTGMRRSEITGLRWEEVHLELGAIRLPGERTKNKCARPVPLNTGARRLLLDARKCRMDGCDLVFHKEDGSPIGDFRKVFKAACRRAGIENFTFHDTRHCFASALAMRGVPLQVIAELLGHKTIAMTQRYAHLSQEVLIGASEQVLRYLADGGKTEGDLSNSEGVQVLQDAHTITESDHRQKDGVVIPLEKQKGWKSC